VKVILPPSLKISLCQSWRISCLSFLKPG